MINNISHFAQKAKHSNGAGPRISLNYTVSRENISDVPKLPSLAASLSIKEVFYRDLITFPGSNYAASDKLSSFDQDFRIKLREAVIKEADTYSIKVNFCESLFSAEGKRNKFCYRPWVSAFIDVNGNFYPCCHITQKNTDIARYSTGNIATCTPDALWNAAMLTNLRSELARGKDTPALCAGCDCLIKIKEQA
jgi:radical SAM protein with 4Fe4S-binding SPASM domain